MLDPSEISDTGSQNQNTIPNATTTSIVPGFTNRITTVRPVATFILAATIRDAPYLMSARTLERSRIALIPSQDVRAAFDRDGQFARAIVAELAQCYRSVVKTTKDLKLRTSLERLANYLLREQKRQSGAAAFDLQAVCSGFIYALATADKFIRSGSHRRALVVGTEVFSRILDWKDRGTCVLFGDGAGAIVIEASETPGIHATALHADGRHRDILSVAGHLSGGQPIGDPFLRMDGQAVFKFAVKVLAEVAEEVIAAAGMTQSQIDWLVPHQANIRIMQSTAKKLHLPSEKVVVTVDRHGNTSAASIPLAFDEAVRSGKVRAGETALLEGVGGGFTWGAALVTL